MKTTLPAAINTIEEAKAFLKALYDNNEAFNPDDDATDLSGDPFTPEEGTKLNKLMADIYNLPGNIDNMNMSFDPCAFLLNQDPERTCEWPESFDAEYWEIMKMESILINDQPTTCPKCGHRTQWEERKTVPEGEPYQLHTCENHTPHYRFKAVEDEEFNDNGDSLQAADITMTHTIKRATVQGEATVNVRGEIFTVPFTYDEVAFMMTADYTIEWPDNFPEEDKATVQGMFDDIPYDQLLTMAK